MAIVEDIMAYKDLGIAGVALVMIYYFSRLIAEKAFGQVDNANKNLAELQLKFVAFMEQSYKDNTKVMIELAMILKDHVRTKDEALEMLKEQQRDRDKK